jgi:tricorn protease
LLGHEKKLSNKEEFMKTARLSALIFSILLLFSVTIFGIQDARLLRTPDINGDLVVFVYAGDIWSVSANGGAARRLTSHEGLEIFPKISPDGKWIAFSAEYSGSRQIYVMPSEGGTPRQLTYYNDVGIMPPRGGFDYIVMDWTPDSRKVLIRANRTPFQERMGKYYLVSLEGGLEEPLQIPEVGFGSFSPDAKKICYTPISREFRTWKRTKGGRAQDVWIYDLENNTSKRITTFVGTDQHPIWYGNKIYFISDQDLRLNFWSYDLKSEKIDQITAYKDFDVLWPSGQNGMVVYENGGYLYKLDLNTLKSTKLTVNINFDNPNILPYFKNVSGFISRFGGNISASGKRAIFDARGDIFTAPAEKGVTVNLTRTQDIREEYPVSSPDGKWICYMSDKTGDYELYLLDPNTKQSVQLTESHRVWKYPPTWSPDSKKLAFYDRNQELQILDIQTKKITLVEKGGFSNIQSIEWSPDSKWITYSKTMENWLRSIWVYSLDMSKSFNLSNGKYNDDSPTFSECGKYIYFISDRDFNLDFTTGFSTMEFDFIYNKTMRLYAMALTMDAPDIFKEENDLEEQKKDEEPKKEDKKSKDKAEKKPEAVVVKIDFENIGNRINAFPLAAGQYGMVLDIGEGKVLYFKNRELRMYNLKDRKDELIIKGIASGSLSADNKKLLYHAGDKWGIIDIKPNQKVGDGALKLDGLTMKIDPVKEWKQIYNEGWRIYRDWFYVKNMHGVDWVKMRDKYSQLLPYVSHRADLDFIFGELVGELNAGHCYVNWGDFKRVTRLDTGLLGAELKADKDSGRYIISKIYQGENWNERSRSPLTEQGVNVKEGDYLISLNGYNLTTRENPYLYLENTAGKRIPIQVNSKPTEQGARTAWIKPISSELQLFYMDWVESRRKMVDRLSNGRIGYIHVPDTAVDGNRELFKGMYAQCNKDALIIDDRYNGGGWDSIKMIEKLSRSTMSYWHTRGLKLQKDPTFGHDGPKVMLINHYSSSGGDEFPYSFRLKKLGILIGTRTWGGLVGYGWSPDLVDGPNFAVPMFGIVNTDGQYTVEGVGVYPDPGFEVYDRPEEIVKVNDPSIEIEVKYLLDQLKKNPPKKVTTPPDPDRSKWFEKEIK